MAASVTELLCILVDNNFQHTIGGAFVVEVPSDGLIVHLKKQIKEERQNLLALIDAADLEVWRLRKPQRSVEIKRNISNFKCLGEVLRNEDEGDDEVAWLVQEDEEILSHFSGLPKNAISVLVWVPPPSKIGDDITGECSIHPPYASLSCLAYTSSFKPPLPSHDVVGQNRAQEDEAVGVAHGLPRVRDTELADIGRKQVGCRFLQTSLFGAWPSGSGRHPRERPALLLEILHLEGQ